MTKRLALIALLVVSSVAQKEKSTGTNSIAPIKCYECNSMLQPDCLSPETLKKEFLTECKDLDKRKSVGCWNLFQEVDYDQSKELKAHKRIVRKCAYYKPEDSKYHCVKPLNYGSTCQQCFCNTTACNSGHHATATLLVSSLLFSVLFIIHY